MVTNSTNIEIPPSLGGSQARISRGCTPHLFAILVLTIILLIFAKFTFRGLPEIPPFALFITPAISPTEPPKRVAVFILPKSATIISGQPFNLEVLADTQGIAVTMIDLTLNFDQTKLSFLQASPSAFFTQQLVFANTVDNKVGSLRVALSSLTPASDSGRLFRLSGLALLQASGSATIAFSPQSLVGGVGIKESVLGEMEGAKLTIVSSTRHVE